MARPHDADARRALDSKIIHTLEALRKQGRTYQSIADSLRLSYVTVYRAINRIDSYRNTA